MSRLSATKPKPTDKATDTTPFHGLHESCVEEAYQSGFDAGFEAGWDGGKEFGLITGAFEAGKIARYDEDQADQAAEDGALSESEFSARLS
jgi:hypothetical protein